MISIHVYTQTGKYRLTAANFVIHSSDTPSEAKPTSCEENNEIADNRSSFSITIREPKI